MSTTIENYCIICKQVADDECEKHGHVVGTLGQVAPPSEQPAPEADEWRVVKTIPERETSDVELYAGNEGLIRLPWRRQAWMEQVCRDHARAALVPGLVEALKGVAMRASRSQKGRGGMSHDNPNQCGYCEEGTVPCDLCGTPTPMTGTRRCDPCWELERRVEQRPEVAKKLVAAMADTNGEPDAQARHRTCML